MEFVSAGPDFATTDASGLFGDQFRFDAHDDNSPSENEDTDSEIELESEAEAGIENMASNQFEVAEPPEDMISSLTFSPSPAGPSTRLLVSSWDKHVYLYEIDAEGRDRLVRKFEHKAAVLDVCFGKDDSEAYSGGLDWDVHRLDLETGGMITVSEHEESVKAVAYSRQTGLLISASWDNTLHVLIPDEPNVTPATIKLPHTPYSMSITPTKVIVAMASRVNHIYDLKALKLLTQQSSGTVPNVLDIEPWQARESSLKFQTRTVRCMPDDAGFAISSIEGRVAVEWFDPSPESQARKYAFKCHRQQGDDGVTYIYPVHALAFHPVYGTFASGGGDGVVALWDGISKRRIRQYQRYPSGIPAVAFSHDGKYLAVATSPQWEDTKQDVGEGMVRVFIRELSDTEAKGKSSK